MRCANGHILHWLPSGSVTSPCNQGHVCWSIQLSTRAAMTIGFGSLDSCLHPLQVRTVKKTMPSTGGSLGIFNSGDKFKLWEPTSQVLSFAGLLRAMDWELSHGVETESYGRVVKPVCSHTLTSVATAEASAFGSYTTSHTNSQI